jgi:hypothetical protein
MGLIPAFACPPADPSGSSVDKPRSSLASSAIYTRSRSLGAMI